MARLDLKLPDEFAEKLSRLGSNFDSVAESMLEAGGEVVLQKAQGNLSGAVGSGTKYPSKATGELAGALGLSPVKIGEGGNHDIKVGFAEPHSGGVSNAMLANLIEYGKHGQPAKPFMKPAKTASRKECIAAMEAELDKEVSQL